ncbi:MAG TPA: cytochrome c oxidase subunit II [Longimicrobiaceae bacterium]
MKSRAHPCGPVPATSTRPERKTAPRRLLRALPALPLLLAGCDEATHLRTYPRSMYAPRSGIAREVLELQNLTAYLGVAVGIFVFALLAYIMLRFRYRPGNPEPEQIHGNTRLELAWTLIPAVILAIIAVPTVRMIFETQREAPANALKIDVIGYQWWWEYRYAVNGGRDTVVTANEIHVPVGRPVQLRMTSKDVIHAFWIPQMGGKRDLIPNKTNTIMFTPEEPGIYLGHCTEFCGDSHALMRMRLIAHTPEGYQEWLRNEFAPAKEPVDSSLAIGKRLVTQGACAGCHVIRGTPMVGRTGPDLTHMARRYTIAGGILENNAHNLTEWLRNPPEVKPGSKMPNLNLKPEEIRYIVAYLQSLE